jgi:hypothetical protein
MVPDLGRVRVGDFMRGGEDVAPPLTTTTGASTERGLFLLLGTGKPADENR